MSQLGHERSGEETYALSTACAPGGRNRPKRARGLRGARDEWLLTEPAPTGAC
jgi:hypothetical protein